ncbi:MAG: hypothetical protein GX800_06565 [Clostridiaceae bacterium]|nr:hypothetical protein [Clostridiaceae bacterium]
MKFTSYRPDGTFGESSASNSYQDENGYYTNTTYWFKYEPLRWRVLDPSSGLVMCESIIDSQAYSNTIYYKPGEYYNNPACTVYANDYATSSMRTWLNGPFLQTAFTSSEQSVVKTTALDNSAYPGYPQYNSASTNDKLFLLSYSESTNAAYGFSADNWDDDHPARYAQGIDYAKSQGLWVNNSPGSDYDKNSEWFLRSPGGYYCNVSNVYYDGNVYFNYLVYNTHFGVRPAFKISNPASLKSASSGSAQASPSASSAAPIFEEEADITPAYSNEAQASPSASSAAPTFEKEAERSPMAAAIIIATGVVIFAAVGIGFFVYWRKK